MAKNNLFAVLLKEKGKDKKLSLILTSDLSSVNTNAKLNKIYEIKGKIKFKTNKSPDDIIDDFSKKYSAKVIWSPYLEEAPAPRIIYPASFELTITHAFVDYFSHIKS